MKIFGIIATFVAFVCVVGANPLDAPKKEANEALASGRGTDGW
ncbi:hypothetical protein Ocin01_10924 [Orchesella cincta]|uniref:Uncharacterized protein n=1 Tax=Orchesella cincta TaxID=48709 RepID=A0A1D2MS79_ORCCI|nr:hypothetical protein Ocin01_10924 [Orchesella cincta]